MSEYWKSQPRHFCEFCKCWIADNKPSRDFHEKGKRHQENVKLKIEAVRKKGTEDARKKTEMEDSFREMEKAALEAFKNDLKTDPSLAAQYGVKLKAAKPAESKSNEKMTSKQDSQPLEESTPLTKESESKECPWSEAKSPEGYTYYWNYVTGDTTWIKPEGYKSPEELEEETESLPTGPTLESNATANSESLTEDNPLPGDIPLPSDQSKEEQEESSSDEEVAEPVEGALGPANKPDPYGGWAKVKVKKQKEVDLQLPVSDNVVVQEQKVIVIQEPKIKFRERKVTPLGTEPVSFKKRKLNVGARSIRQREES